MWQIWKSSINLTHNQITSCHSTVIVFVCLFVTHVQRGWYVFYFALARYAELPRVVRVAQMLTDPGERKKVCSFIHICLTLQCPNANYLLKWVLSPGFKLMDSDAKIWTVLQGLLAWRVMHDTWHVRFLFVTSSSLPLIFDTLSSFQGTISQYFSTMTCPVCQELTPTDLCINCRARPQLSAVTLASRMRKWERTHQHLAEVGWVPLWWRHDLHHGTWYNTIQYWF